eukprot:gene16908-20106_t
MYQVGTQADLRADTTTLEALQLKGQIPLTFEEGLMMKKKIGAKAFCECSVQSMKGVKQVFEEAIRIYVESQSEVRKSRNKNNCIIL